MRPCCAMVAVAALAGCLSVDTAICGEKICAVGQVCTPSGDDCADPQAIAVCVGQADGVPCRFGVILEASCQGGVCRQASCGNLVVEPGEVCDDGNSYSGDGCFFACQSDESCGNGILDSAVGEICDSSPDLRGDGCDLCVGAAPFWYELHYPYGRDASALGHHIGLGRTVMFGGTVSYPDGYSGTSDETLEWEGSWWRRVEGFPAPAPRRAHAIAYDAARQELLVFGGVTSNSAQDDRLWKWKGRWTWADAEGPSARSGPAMAYDAARQVVVLYGGVPQGAQQPAADMWLWDGTDWQSVELPANGGPPNLADHAMAYDPIQQRTVMCGGVTGEGVSARSYECWSWDGEGWEQLGDVPESRCAMTFDPVRGRLVYVAANAADPTVLETCTLGSVWECADIDLLGRPSLEILPQQLVFDTREQALLMTGLIFDDEVTKFFQGTWVEQGGVWKEIVPEDPPSATPDTVREGAGYYDPLRGRAVFLAVERLYEFDGASWFEAQDNSPLEARRGQAIALDPLGRGVMFGGNVDLVPQADTFAWDGSSWTALQPATSPLARKGHAMAFDWGNRRTVLFGGLLEDGTYFNDTWAWDGETWTELVGAAPSGRDGAVMGYDRARKELILFGGAQSTPGDKGGDTWRLEPNGWEPVSDEGPSPRSRALLVYDENRRRLILSGGFNNFEEALTDTWEWNGETERWIPVGVESLGFVRAMHGGAYHALTSRLVSVGGTVDFQELVFSFGLLDRDDRCDLAVDIDGDQRVGCQEPSCWARCTPLCAPTKNWPDDCDPTQPHCGDGECNSYLESWRSCPADCDPVPVCGDFLCEGDEDEGTCPGDCPAL